MSNYTLLTALSSAPIFCSICWFFLSLLVIDLIFLSRCYLLIFNMFSIFKSFVIMDYGESLTCPLSRPDWSIRGVPNEPLNMKCCPWDPNNLLYNRHGTHAHAHASIYKQKDLKIHLWASVTWIPASLKCGDFIKINFVCSGCDMYLNLFFLSVLMSCLMDLLFLLKSIFCEIS